jgi:error-prone DNA polymerase
MYLELHTASAFSFLDGASMPSSLIERAAELGYPALALLDRNGLYGAPQFYRAAKAAGLKAIVGAELTMGSEVALRSATQPGGRAGGARSHPSRRWTLPVLVASAEGYRHLCRILTRAHLRSPKGEAVVTFDDLDGHTTGLVALVGREALRADRHGVGGLVDRVIGLFGRANVWMELQRHLQRDDQADVQSLLDLGAAFRVPVMASGGVKFATPEARPLYDVLTSIRHHTTLSGAGRRLTVNAERYLKPPQVMARLFSDLPQALAGTEALAERLEFTLANLGYCFPEYPVPTGETQASFLRRLTQVGARDRYRPYHDKARAQVERELTLIERLDLAGYFLIVWDIVNFCRQQGILVQGRGSAANSAVCYALGITAVDPVGMDLLFERFLSEERGEWPDIDLDLPSGDRRERVIQYVYQRYGQFGAAMTANVITYRGRSATRELGKVLGLEADEVDRLARMMAQFEFVDPEESVARNLREAGLNPDEDRYRQFATLWREMQDLPRHLGQHSGGMVLCQGRLDDVVPLENASMPGRVVVQWDKDDCADLGIIKVDLLGLGMMAALEEAIDIVNGHDDGSRGGGTGASRRPSPHLSPVVPVVPVVPEALDLAHLPPDDPLVYRMLQRADTVGVFQVESRAQMATLPRMKPERFYDLVVEVAIIRPGPIVGGMVHPYLARRAGDEPVTYAHPLLEPVLARTLGVPLFQEQLLRMAMVVAGFSGGEAEELRRAMGFKRSVRRMQQIETRLREGMAQNGIVGAVADQIVLSISSFALYGFPESHAASFALIVYASAYLKAHFPAAFYTALLNNQPMGFYHPATLVKDAQRHCVRFAPVDVQVSMWNCVVQPDGVIRLGIRYVRGVREEAGRTIEDSGTTGTTGDRRFETLDALVRVARLRQDEVRALAACGALASFGGDRRTALWQAERAGRPAGPLLGDDASDVSSTGDAPEMSPLEPMTMRERVQADYDSSGLTIGPHPMALVRASLAARGVVRAIDLPRGRAGRRVRVAGAVITRQRPGTAKGFVFLSMEDETGISNVIITPDVYSAFKRTIVDQPYLLVEGTLQNQRGAVSVKADRVMALQGAGPDVESHDFH